MFGDKKETCRSGDHIGWIREMVLAVWDLFVCAIARSWRCLLQLQQAVARFNVDALALGGHVL